MDNKTEQQRQAAYNRWIQGKLKRREIALKIMTGERDYDPNWPNWLCYDIKAEIEAIRKERQHDASLLEAEKRAKAARDAVKDILL